MTISRSSNPPPDARSVTPPATDRALSDDDIALIVQVREYLDWYDSQPPSPWTVETVGLITGRLERRWQQGQWRTVDASTGKPMKLDSETQWLMSLREHRSRTDG